MGREIERKFLVKDLPADLDRHPCAPITQGYLPVENGGFQIRLRREAAKRLLTIKCGHGRARFEAEFAVPKKDFDSLWELTGGRRIAKKRYRIPAAGGFLVQLDVYQGKHRGLATAEVEFDSKKQSVRFRPPPWFGREVTGNRHFENATLARKQRR
jgi:CYTH domain-containing protein